MRFPQHEALGLPPTLSSPRTCSGVHGAARPAMAARAEPPTPERVRHDGLANASSPSLSHPGLVPGRAAVSRQRIEAERDSEVIPSRIVALDQVLLPVARPLLDALFSSNSRFHCLANVIPDQTLDVVALGETVKSSIAVLHDPTDKVGRNASVEPGVEATRQHVDARFALSHAVEVAAQWMPEQVRHDEFGGGLAQ